MIGKSGLSGGIYIGMYAILVIVVTYVPVGYISIYSIEGIFYQAFSS